MRIVGLFSASVWPVTIIKDDEKNIKIRLLMKSEKRRDGREAVPKRAELGVGPEG
jgi:hypothetical protein